MKKTLFFVLALLSFSSLSSQIIWSESFTYADGTTTGADNNAPAGADWTSSCATCVPPNDWFEVRSGKMEGQDTNGPGELVTEQIDISTYLLGVEFLVDLDKSGTMEGCLTNVGGICDFNCVDWVNVAYSLDGGPFVEVTTPAGGACGGTYTWASGNYAALGDFSPFSVLQSGLTGNTLQIRVSVQNWAGSEVHFIDNIVVTEPNTLPVELLDFAGIFENNLVNLSWEVEDEVNMDGYAIMRKSAREPSFEQMGFVSATGLTNYEFNDPISLSEPATYQLKMVNMDGTYSLSNTIEIGEIFSQSLKLYPNPATTHIRFEYPQAQIRIIEIYDLTGRQVKKINVDAQELDLDISDLVPSLYQFRALTDATVLKGSFSKR